jgi:CHAT domain-containing protein
LLMPRIINPLEVELPLKILVVCATPSDCQPLNVTDEKQKIGQQLKKMRLKTKVKLDVLNHATIEKLRDRIKKYHVIHFIGHGGFIRQQGEEIGCLMFESQYGKSDLIHSVRFSLILRDTKVRLVILNACETAKTSTYNAFLGVAPALVNAGIPAVIAMQFPMPDSSAVMFSEEFYNSLSQYYQVDAAVTDARIAMAERIGVDRIDWGIPVLFMQSPDGILFRPKTF